MQDRETGSAWSQVTGRAIDGKAKGAQLQKMQAVETTWASWFAGHPETVVLKKSEEVLDSHYRSYFEDPESMGVFRGQWLTERMPGKTLVFGLSVGLHAAALTDDALEGGRLVAVDLGGTPVVVMRGADDGVRAWIPRSGGTDLELTADPKGGVVRDADGSTWDLVSGRCSSGPRAGESLESVAVTPVYWFAWSNFYPNTKVVDGSWS